MAAKEKLMEYLKQAKVAFEVKQHAEAFTAQETAASMHVPGAQLAKVVMVKLDGALAMLVLPAKCSVDFTRLGEATGAKKILLAKEEDFAAAFPDSDLGAMPPFGNLYGIPVWVDRRVSQNVNMVFNACSHMESIRMAYSDWEKMVRPKTADFCAQT